MDTFFRAWTVNMVPLAIRVGLIMVVAKLLGGEKVGK